MFGKPRFSWLDVEETDGFVTWAMRSEKRAVGGIVVSVYNDPNKSDTEIEYARVPLTFIDTDTQEILVIGDAWWIDETFESTNLRVGDQKYVLILVVGKEDQPAALANTARTFAETGTRYNKESVKTTELSGKHYTVELCLIHGGNSQLKEFCRFDLSLEESIAAFRGQ